MNTNLPNKAAALERLDAPWFQSSIMGAASVSRDVGQIMNVPEFIIAFLQAVAWPAVVVTLALTFRSDLAALLGRISTFKHKETELQFGRELAEAADEVRRESSAGAEYLSTPEARKILAVLEIDPKAAIIAAWVEFESAARAALPQKLGSERPSPIPHVIDALLASGRLHKSDAEFLGVLRRLRNAVLHSAEAPVDQEMGYKAVTALLVMAWELRHPE
ncbi:MAG: hypothetical protein U1G08_15095 [Verrucomicrobiota bacterium]